MHAFSTNQIADVLHFNDNCLSFLRAVQELNYSLQVDTTLITLVCQTLREKCPNTEFFLVRIFPLSG